MLDRKDGVSVVFPKDRDEAEIQMLLTGLRGSVSSINDQTEANLLQCATLALFHGRRMAMASQDAFDALAAICLVLGERRLEFFENVFISRMMDNPNLTAREKLNRIVEVVIGTVPRPSPSVSNDNLARETA